MEKTNVMRLLEQKKVVYEAFDYSASGLIAGKDVASFLKESELAVFKTLVCVSGRNIYYVFMLPVAYELDLKKAAKAVGEKSMAMLKSKDLLPLTGYVHGGCSPLGMKKTFKTVIHESFNELTYCYFSAGRIGYQIKLECSLLKKVLAYTTADLIQPIEV